MAKLNLSYYSGSGSYSDGDVEIEILELVKSHKSLEELEDSEVSYPVLYHLSKVRQNILLWYPFEEGCSILEVGSGCGALTELLCQKAGSVTSVELSERRASINYERNQAYDNLEILVGNLSDVPENAGFDYVVLNGVYEYAASFTDGDKPYEAFLKALALRLKDTGTILIAIENRLGAKYFAGAPEDHVDQYFCGIEEYPGINSVRTFSKQEWISLCRRTGLVCQKFYYPYPDYKFPYEIFTDETINSPIYGRDMFQLHSKRIRLFSEEKLNRTLAREGAADIFANSFLLVIQKQATEEKKQIDYVKINTDRAREFQIYTTIWKENGEKHVSKYPASPVAFKHIAQMQENSGRKGKNGWENLSGTLGPEGEIVYPFLPEQTLEDIAARLIMEQKPEEITKLLQEVMDTFLSDTEIRNDFMTEEFQKVFGEETCGAYLKCVKDVNIDIILDNIFCCDGRYVLIDTEWVFPFAIPGEYVMWRMLNELYFKHQDLYEMLDYNETMELFGIQQELTAVFRKWEMHFANEYVKSCQIKKYAVPEIDIGLSQIVQDKVPAFVGKIYLDRGKGYGEDDAAYSKKESAPGTFRQEFLISGGNIADIRWDPIERPCICRITRVEADGKPLQAAAVNKAYAEDGRDVFLTFDPVYKITGELCSGTTLIIEGEIEVLDYEGLVQISQPLWNKEFRSRKDIGSKVKNSNFVQRYAGRRAVINFLKRVKHFGGRVYRKLRRAVPKKEKYDNLFQVWKEWLSQEEPAHRISEEVIDVIVPIYNGYDYLVKLFEDLPKTGMKCRFLLVDDKSPDERVHKLEKSFAASRDNVILLENDKNYGFVKSVNNALSQTRNHVALVNTDTELPEGWLERLMEPVLYGDKVASATPFTNSGTIFSFPDFCYNNEIYRGLDVDTIDAYFRKIVPHYTAMPTGVGFCMGLNKQAIEEIGILDYETFSKGFGEENDWCQRAIKKGYKNVQVENLFVYHKHGGSFVSREKEALLSSNLEKLKKRYPTYDMQVSALIRKDPNREVRRQIQMMIDTGEGRSALFFDHSLGGGATGYLNRKKEELIKEGFCVSVIRYMIEGNNFRFLFENERESFGYEFDAFEQILEIGSMLRFDDIYINELVTYPNLQKTQELIVNLKQQQDATLIMLFHDFFALCPTINLLNDERRYCGMPDREKCQRCYLQKGFDSQYRCRSMEDWKSLWKGFLAQCTEVRTFSEDTEKRARAAFGNSLKLTIVPHKVEYMFPIYKESKTTGTLNIGLLGILAIHKGSEIVAGMLKEIEEKQLPVTITLLGQVEGTTMPASPSFKQTGRYATENLPRLIYENDIDIFFIPSVWPETFSYTAEEIMQMGMPLACFDLGAPADRARRYDKGILIERMEPSLALERILQYGKDNIGAKPAVLEGKRMIFLAEYLSFASRYRAEHMMEELLYQGVKSEFYEVKKLPGNIDWSSVAGIVIYRCRYLQPLAGLMEKAKEQHIPLYYDIDDFIFDFQAIKNLPFLQQEEYLDFEAYSGAIRECMENCDKLTVSTDHLEMAVSRVFPSKPVFVNRNMASAQMLILSANALMHKNNKKDRVVLGYFSGSHTHSRDFELISEIVAQYMKENDRIWLKVVGCLELGEQFEELKNRIIRVDFMPWEELPSAIASVDINLMPLENTFFHACKSENKWLEAALVKVSTIGSYNDEIAGCTKPGENILLCRSKQEWRQELGRLAEDCEFRDSVAEKAYEFAVGYKTTLHKNPELLEFIVKNSVKG